MRQQTLAAAGSRRRVGKSTAAPFGYDGFVTGKQPGNQLAYKSDEPNDSDEQLLECVRQHIPQQQQHDHYGVQNGQQL